jgi:hypothetical protein
VEDSLVLVAAVALSWFLLQGEGMVSLLFSNSGRRFAYQPSVQISLPWFEKEAQKYMESLPVVS